MNLPERGILKMWHKLSARGRNSAFRFAYPASDPDSVPLHFITMEKETNGKVIQGCALFQVTVSSVCYCHGINGKDSAMLTILIRWLVFVHVLAAITFFLAHGTSAVMAFPVRKATDFSRIRALLDLSWSTMVLMGVSFLIMGLTGIILPFMIHIWNRIYIWLSIVLMLFVFIYMAMYNETRYKELRRLVGLPYMKGNKQLPAKAPSSPEEVSALLKKTSVTSLVVVGYVIPAIVLWLMIFKPF